MCLGIIVPADSVVIGRYEGDLLRQYVSDRDISYYEIVEIIEMYAVRDRGAHTYGRNIVGTHSTTATSDKCLSEIQWIVTEVSARNDQAGRIANLGDHAYLSEICVEGQKIISAGYTVHTGGHVHIASGRVHAEPHHPGIRLHLNLFQGSGCQVVLGKVIIPCKASTGIQEASHNAHGHADGDAVQCDGVHLSPIRCSVNGDFVRTVRHVEQVVDFVQGDPIAGSSTQREGGAGSVSQFLGAWVPVIHVQSAGAAVDRVQQPLVVVVDNAGQIPGAWSLCRSFVCHQSCVQQLNLIVGFIRYEQEFMICVDRYPHGAEHFVRDVVLGLIGQLAVRSNVVRLDGQRSTGVGLLDIRDDVKRFCRCR